MAERKFPITGGGVTNQSTDIWKQKDCTAGNPHYKRVNCLCEDMIKPTPKQCTGKQSILQQGE